MNQMNILLVEDNDRMIELFETAIEEWNENNVENNQCFECKIAKNSEGAFYLMEGHKFDAVVVDLRLPEIEDGKELAKHGNEFALSVVDKRGVPIVIVSANTADLDSKLKQMDAVTCISKTEGYGPVVNWLADQWDMMNTLKEALSLIHI